MIFQSISDSQSNIEMSIVRFGNVIGSNGSAIPLFNEQIQNGGPVTITHPEVTRYFMTIPEASSLVIQASAMSKKDEIFVLDMGKPIKILDIAKNIDENTNLDTSFTVFEDLSKKDSDRFQYVLPSFTFSKNLMTPENYNGNFSFISSGFQKNYQK